MGRCSKIEEKRFFRNKRFRKVFLTTFVGLAFVASIFIQYSYTLQRDQVISRISEYYSQILFNKATFVRSVITPVISNLNFLTSHRSVIGYMKNPENSEKLIEDMKLFAQNNIHYKQVRFIDNEGMEKIRINWNGGQIEVVPDSLLQNKSHRYYFVEAMKVPPGTVYISPVDLNAEFGKVEVPYQSVVRVATKILDEDGNTNGIIVINLYLNELLIGTLQNDIFSHDNFHFLNSEGYWIDGPAEYKTYGFMFDSLQNEKFSNYFPELWTQVDTTGFGSIEGEEMLCVFRHILLTYDPLHYGGITIESSSSDWLFAYLIDYDNVSELVSLKNTVVWLSILVFVVLFLLSFVIAYLRMKELRHIQNLRLVNETLEHRIHERTKEISQKNRELEDANSELEAFTYSVSHDLRSPLRHISGFVDLLIRKYRDELGADGARYIDYVKEASLNMGHLIDDLLQLSRVGRGEISEAKVDVKKLVLDCMKRIEKDFPDQTIEWKISPLESVVADYNLLTQVWINLLGNAVKYSSKAEVSLIEINCSELDDFIMYSVKDNGIGFDETYKDKLFTPFQRLHSSEDFEGTGIGLAIVRRIISRFGGQIWGESKPNEGATFTFILPIKQTL